MKTKGDCVIAVEPRRKRAYKIVYKLRLQKIVDTSISTMSHEITAAGSLNKAMRASPCFAGAQCNVFGSLARKVWVYCPGPFTFYWRVIQNNHRKGDNLVSYPPPQAD
ncbi:hypothetical protein RRG08_051863 [Elysia crispata]|uniref:Uncharacterized protein n=1 Tax=Elysia crispata TaxID=231223 RepID=A0AAE1DC40_9GAST|nr:hypothetical protein RRG08_051863 [Elysia crispata]